MSRARASGGLEAGYRLLESFLPEGEARRWLARIESRRALFQPVAVKAGMNLPYHVIDGHTVKRELPDVYELILGPLHQALEAAVGRPLSLMRDRKRAVRIQWYRRAGDGIRWHLDGGMFSVVLTLLNTNRGATQIIPLALSRYVKPIPYLLFPFPGILARLPNRWIEGQPGDLILIQGGATVHRGVNLRDDGERLVVVASFDLASRRPTPVWDWLARRLNY